IGPGIPGYVDISKNPDINTFIGTLVLIIILFEGGMELNIFDVIHRSGRGILMGVSESLISMVFCAVAFYFVFHLNPLVGAIFGVIAGGSTPQIVLPILKKLNVSNEVKHFFIIESSATDGLSLVIAIMLVAALVTNSFNLHDVGQMMLSYLSVGAVLGIVIGMATVLLMSRAKVDYPYMMIIAVLISLYVFAEYFQGSGVMAVLFYGIVLGNRKEIGDMLKFKGLEDDTVTKLFQAEISFFISTFFFIYMGTMVHISSISNIIEIALVAMAALSIAKIIASFISTFGTRLANYNKLIIFMQAKGIEIAALSIMLPTIVLSQYPNSPNLAVARSQLSMLPNLSIAVIILSIVINSIGVFIFKGRIQDMESGDEVRKEEKEKAKKAIHEKMGSNKMPKKENEESKEQEKPESKENPEPAKHRNPKDIIDE
ncbi:MAG: cation:proton antiporter, partial [Candidatus Micrarchaeota archaeon]|nr:cation:proton antiporter [Candidatus Micrarchaeota archaeon]